MSHRQTGTFPVKMQKNAANKYTKTLIQSSDESDSQATPYFIEKCEVFFAKKSKSMGRRPQLQYRQKDKSEVKGKP